MPLYWLLIYPDKWEKANYLHGVGEMSPQWVIMRAENWSKGDRICGGQQFQTTGAGQTKDPSAIIISSFHTMERFLKVCCVCSVFEIANVVIGNCASRMHLIKAAIVRFQISYASELHTEKRWIV